MKPLQAIVLDYVRSCYSCAQIDDMCIALAASTTASAYDVRRAALELVEENKLREVGDRLFDNTTVRGIDGNS